MIAQDVIAQVLRGDVLPVRGSYVSLDHENVVCEVCAIGGMWMSRFACGDEDDPNDVEPSYMRRKLRESADFSRLQLAMIESAFEGAAMGWELEAGEGYPDLDSAAEFFWAKHDPECDLGEGEDPELERACILAIMQNIVDNSGEFVP